jgi:signal transduction histidine kinase
VAREVGLLVGGDMTHIGRFEDEDAVRLLASWSPSADPVAIGTVAPVGGDNVCAAVLQTGRPARMQGYDDASGPIAVMMRALGIRSSVGAPIVVDGRRWGAAVVSSKDEEPLAVDAEDRIAAFTELVAAAISNTESQVHRVRLADEQAALRRVATLVAQAVSPSELFTAVIAEVGTLLGVDRTGMVRYEADGTATAVATWTREDDRVDVGDDSIVESPVVVQGRTWGALFVYSAHDEPLAAGTAERLGAFTELVATAISNSEARAEVERLAEEQAGLRRVATLVADESPSAVVLAAVAEQVGLVLHADDTRLVRYENDGTVTVVASWGMLAEAVPVGTNRTLEGNSVSALVLQTKRPARIDDYSQASGSVGEDMRSQGMRSAVGTPIVVDGRVWGAIMVGSLRDDGPLPADTEFRIGQFCELLATAIANIQGRADLAASRARIVAAADDERRRVVRDLHDGAQQRLVHMIITLKMACRVLESGGDALPLMTEAVDHGQQTIFELRELAHGLLPAVVTRGGLPAGVRALTSRMTMPVEVDVDVGRLPTTIEATAYFVVAEALTNVAKHARANHATVLARVEGSLLRVRVQDDGVGGARPDGHGLLGLADRVAVLGGRLLIEDPAGGGTVIAADLPLPG